MLLSWEKKRTGRMRVPIFQVVAFTNRLFGGNPAAVMPLQSFPNDSTLQAIAAENNLAETASLIRLVAKPAYRRL
jgi:PhzF family phenazine biosynthesis protein